MTRTHHAPALMSRDKVWVLIERLKARAKLEQDRERHDVWRDLELIDMLFEAAFQLQLMNERRTR